MRNMRKSGKHPLTDQYIALVGGGTPPLEAAMSLIGPLLSLHEVQNQLFDWECDGEVDARVKAAIAERHHAAQTVREATVERLLAIINQDVRKFFRQTSADGAIKTELVPITLWSKWMSGAVKKVKYTQKTDPFGNTTDTMNLEFHDPLGAMKALCTIAPEVYDVVKLNEKDGAIDVTALESMSDAELDELHMKLLKAI